jgi:hypothetical protein
VKEDAVKAVPAAVETKKSRRFIGKTIYNWDGEGGYRGRSPLNMTELTSLVFFAADAFGEKAVGKDPSA